MNQQWVRQWLGTEKLPSHYQGSNEGPAYWRIYASLGLNKFPSKYRTKTIKRILHIYKNICTTLQHYIHESFHIPSHTHIHIKIGIFVYVYMYALIYPHSDDSVQDRSNSIDNALELPQPRIKSSKYTYLSWAHSAIHSQTTTMFKPIKAQMTYLLTYGKIKIWIFILYHEESMSSLSKHELNITIRHWAQSISHFIFECR